MRKILSILAICVFLFHTANAITIAAPAKAKDIMIPIGKTGKSISLLALSTISEKQFEEIAGKKLGFADRLMFKAGQRKIRNSINPDGTINNKKIEQLYKHSSDKSGHSFNLGGFALGLFLSLVGVLIAYIINDNKNKSRRKWAWIGFGIGVFLFLLLLVLAAASLGNWN